MAVLAPKRAARLKNSSRSVSLATASMAELSAATHAADGMTVEEIDAEIRRIFDEAAARNASDGRLIEGEAIPPEDE